MEGLRLVLGEGPQLAYLSYMGNRLLECHRVLKSTGSIYLHCDPTMSHYLKTVLDGILGHGNFRNEIIWKRTGAHNSAKRCGPVHDILLSYSKGQIYTWNQQYQEQTQYILARYTYKDDDGRYFYPGSLIAAGTRRGSSGEVWRGIDVTSKGNHWRYGVDRLEQLDAANGVYWPPKSGMPRLKMYLDEAKGSLLQDVWDDISSINSQAKERLGYPTQKPVALLERIIRASSNEGDVLLDPFCGCGTAIHAAQNLDRSWVGIDICVNACKVIEKRLKGHFDSLWSGVEFIGMPKTAPDAKTLASIDKFRFERWAASLVDGMEANKKQRGDGGIDGWGRIAIRKGQFIDMVSQVKGGGTGPGDVQAFNGARQQAGADLGIFTCFEDRVTPRMRDAAASTGRFMEVPTVQIYTVDDYFNGRRPAMPIAV